ncbi:MAG: flagellar basal body P-ring formation protein FlgA [Ignavibacterium sp.]|uniref:flagellar basal body P-ring formation chaperone FlgA n=1 Tax=Ignavibacterium sp. TaxID=2651167 RepID=UPI003296B165
MFLILVILLSVSLSAQDFNSEVEIYLNKKLKGYDKIEFSILNDIKDYKYKIDESREFKFKGATAYLPVKYPYGNKSVNSILTLQIKLYKKVLVAIQEIKRKEKIDASSYSVQTVEIASLKNPEIVTLADLNSIRAKSLIKEGQIITKDLIEEIPVIQSGSKVIAECIKGSVLISTEAVARQDGKVDEVIDVLTASNELIKARVINSQKVLIE